SMEEIFDSVKAAAIIHKCLVGDTLVMSAGLRRLSEIAPGAQVMTDEGPFYVSELHDNGEQRVVEVQTHRGHKIVGTREHRFTVGSDCPEVVERIKTVSHRLFGKTPTISAYRDARAVEVALLSRQIKEWFRSLGVTKVSAREARVPEIILGSTEEVAAAFVR